MSSGTLAVRFPDGEILYGVYYGTADTCMPCLFHTVEEAWDHRRAWPKEIAALGDEGEDVVVATDYGGGFYWDAVAVRGIEVGAARGALVRYLSPWGYEEVKDGWPTGGIVDERGHTNGRPDWWPLAA